MIKITYQRAKELNLIIEPQESEDINTLIENYQLKLKENSELLNIVRVFLGEDEKLVYLLANNFETINMSDMDKDLNMVVPELLTVFTDKRVLCFKNIKNKAYYRNKNQVPGLERKLHLFDSCTIFKYSKIEQVFIVKNSISIHFANSTSVDKFDKGILDLELPDFSFNDIVKLLGTYM